MLVLLLLEDHLLLLLYQLLVLLLLEAHLLLMLHELLVLLLLEDYLLLLSLLLLNSHFSFNCSFNLQDRSVYCNNSNISFIGKTDFHLWVFTTLVFGCSDIIKVMNILLQEPTQAERGLPMPRTKSSFSNIFPQQNLDNLRRAEEQLEKLEQLGEILMVSQKLFPYCLNWLYHRHSIRMHNLSFKPPCIYTSLSFLLVLF